MAQEAAEVIVETCTHPRCFNPRPCPNPQHRIEKAFYSTRLWRATRKQFLLVHPLCRQCEQEKRYTPATEVDHIRPIASGGDRYDWANLQALCKPHHSAKTRRERA